MKSNDGKYKARCNNPSEHAKWMSSGLVPVNSLRVSDTFECISGSILKVKSKSKYIVWVEDTCDGTETCCCPSAMVKWKEEPIAEIVKRSVCCRIEYSLQQFRALKFVGSQPIDDGNEPTSFELRNCPCGSTLSIGIDKTGNYYPEEDGK